MKDSVKNKVEGKADELVGKAKANLGKAADDPELEGEGRGQELGGKVQKKVGDIQKVFEK